MSLREDVAAIAARVQITGQQTYRWDGEEQTVDPNRPSPVVVSPDTPPIIAEVAGRIYEELYAGSPGRRRAAANTDRPLEFSFRKELEAANGTKRSWSPGWKRAEERGEGVIVERGIERLHVAPSRLRKDGNRFSVALEPGTAELFPGWYIARGSLDHTTFAGSTVRIYWNVCAQGAVPLLATASRELDRARIPFRLKTLVDPQRYQRADASVLYIPKRAWPLGARLERIRSVVGLYLKESVPLFTARIGPGLAWAEDPGGADSFGTSRSRLVGLALYDVWKGPQRDPVRAAERRFRAAGINPRRPHASRPRPRGEKRGQA